MLLVTFIASVIRTDSQEMVYVFPLLPAHHPLVLTTKSQCFVPSFCLLQNTMVYIFQTCKRVIGVYYFSSENITGDLKLKLTYCAYCQ